MCVCVFLGVFFVCVCVFIYNVCTCICHQVTDVRPHICLGREREDTFSMGYTGCVCVCVSV